MDASVGIVTALNPYIGYQRAAAIAKESLKTRVPVKKLVVEKGYMTKEQLDAVLNPGILTQPHGVAAIRAAM